jgi:hypothetical protein
MQRQQFPRSVNSLFAGKIAEAEALATSDMFSIPCRMPCYETLCDLPLNLSPSGLTDKAKVEEQQHLADRLASSSAFFWKLREVVVEGQVNNAVRPGRSIAQAAEILLGQSLRNLEHQNFGFETEGRYIAWINPMLGNYKPEQLEPMFGD